MASVHTLAPRRHSIHSLHCVSSNRNPVAGIKKKETFFDLWSFNVDLKFFHTPLLEECTLHSILMNLAMFCD